MIDACARCYLSAGVVCDSASQVLQSGDVAAAVRQDAMGRHAADRTGAARRGSQDASECQLHIQGAHSVPAGMLVLMILWPARGASVASVQHAQGAAEVTGGTSVCVKAQAHETAETADIFAEACSGTGAGRAQGDHDPAADAGVA